YYTICLPIVQPVGGVQQDEDDGGEIAAATGAAHLVVPGHYPHTQQPERVNAALEHLWEAADQG
ncbi:hypothetical protein ACFC13_30095, partial [Streptomyces sp. NPDC056081]